MNFFKVALPTGLSTDQGEPGERLKENDTPWRSKLTVLEAETPVLLARPSVWFGAGCHIHPSGCQYMKDILIFSLNFLYFLQVVHHGTGCLVSGFKYHWL